MTGIQQSGPVLPGHLVQWSTEGVVQDGGPIPSPQILASLRGANFNTMADQPISLPASITSFQITGILIANASSGISVATGGFYPATSKGGVPLSFETFFVSGPNSLMQANINGYYHQVLCNNTNVGTLNGLLTVWLSLTIPEGRAVTADVYLIGLALPGSPVTAPANPLSSAIGLWYMDGYTSPAPGKTVIPNAATTTPLSTNLVLGPRRQFYSYGFTDFYTSINVGSIIDNNAVAPDGTTQASTIVTGNGVWSIGSSLTTAQIVPGQVYTVGIWAKSVTGGAYFEFVALYGTPITSPKKFLSTSWQRFSFTLTAGTATNSLIGIGATEGGSTSAVIDIIDFTIYPGTVDLGTENLAGHIYLLDAGNTTYSNGLLTQAGDHGVIQFAPTPYYSTLAFTVMAVTQPVVSPLIYRTLQGYLSRINDDALFVGWNLFDVVGGMGLGVAGGGSLNLLAEPQALPWLFDQPLASGNGLAVVAYTWNAATNIQECWVNGVKLLSSHYGFTAENPGFIDLWFNLLAHNDHICYNTYSILALWDTCLTPSQIQAATALLPVRSASMGNLLQNVKWFMTIGDQCAALQFPFIAALTTSPRVRGADYGYTDASVLTGTAFSAVVARVVAAYNSPLPTGQEMVCLVYVGGSDIGTGNAAAVAAALSPYLDTLRRAGIKVIACTLFDRQNASQTQYNTDRAAFNAIVSTWVGVHCDALVNFAAVTHMGANGDHTNATYFQAGGILQTTTGDGLLAVPVVTAVNSL